MLTREVVLPVGPEELWTALTDPGQASAWFGGTIAWELEPGGRARFVDEDGSERLGVINEVRPPHRLCWDWWPATSDAAEEDQTSEVTYVLDEVAGGTRLTVTERRRGAPAGATPRVTASAYTNTVDTRALRITSGASTETVDAWGLRVTPGASTETVDTWGLRVTGLWVHAAGRCRAVATV